MANTLEEVLQQYFGCKVPFRKDGNLTITGATAFKKLESLLNDLRSIGVIEKDSNYENQIYDILNENI